MSDGEVLETSADGQFRVRIVPDSDSPNPREDYDHAAHALTVNDYGRYVPVDADGGPLADAFDRLDTLDADMHVTLFTLWARIFHAAVVVESKPYEGAHAVWYMTGAEIADQGITDPKLVINGEITEYRQWADGDVYGYVVEELTGWTNDDDAEKTMQTWEEVDSCWGYYGYEYASSEAKSALAAYVTSEEGK